MRDKARGRLVGNSGLTYLMGEEFFVERLSSLGRSVLCREVVLTLGRSVLYREAVPTLMLWREVSFIERLSSCHRVTLLSVLLYVEGTFDAAASSVVVFELSTFTMEENKISIRTMQVC